MNEVTILEATWGYWVLSRAETLAGLVKANYVPNGVEFLTPSEQSLQVAVMKRESGLEIPAHEHLPVGRATHGTQEVLVIKSGILRVDLYNSRVYVGSFDAHAGDIVILVGGGHGFVAKTECSFVEVKQGPYIQSRDKEVFTSVTASGTKVRYLN